MILMFTPNILVSQNASDSYKVTLPNMILPSPTAQVFQKFMGYRPDLSTGAINIEIPLYTLKINEFKLPFSLRYHTSGIKVNDISHPVGYGWAFSPGLRISRITMGRPDEIFNREIRHEDLSDFKYLRNTQNDFTSEKIDSQYDIFTLHLPSGNTTFLLEPSDNGWKALCVDVPYKIEIIINNHNIEGFRVIDENNLTYEFGMDYNHTEQTVFHNSDAQLLVNTSWVLKKIILPGNVTNNTIEFTWKRTSATPFVQRRNSKFHYYLTDKYFDYYLSGGCDTSPQTGFSEGGNSFEANTSSCLILEKVKCTTSEIILLYDLIRDVSYGETTEIPYLKSFAVNSNSSEILKTTFLYGSGNEKNLLKELKTADQAPYLFQYNSTFFDKRHGFSQDYWGYYNNKPNGGLVPSMTIKYSRSSQLGYAIGVADRSVNVEAMQAFMLKKITYPTGGYTEFEYEPHKFEPYTGSDMIKNNPILSIGGGLRIKETRSTADLFSPTITKRYTYGKNGNGIGQSAAVPSLETFLDERYYLSLGGDECGLGFSQCKWKYQYRKTMVNGYSNYNSYLQFCTPIWYQTVLEETIGNTTKDATIYEYTYDCDQTIDFYFSGSYDYMGEVEQLFPPSIIYSYKNLYTQGPSLIAEKQLLWNRNTSQYQTQKSTYYNFRSLSIRDALMSLHTERFIIRMTPTSYGYFYSDPDFPVSTNNIACTRQETSNYFYRTFYIPQNTLKLAQKKEVLYNEKDSIVQNTYYEYVKHDDRIFNLRTIISDTDNEKAIKEELLYPNDNLAELSTEQKAYIPNMISSNLITKPVRRKQLLKKGSTYSLLNQKTSQYRLFPSNLVLPEKEYYKTDNNVEEVRIQYHNYDQYGNPVYITKDGSDKLTYLWSYNGQYPIAEIRNATYAEISSAVKSVFGTNVTIDALSGTLLPNEIKLKDGSLQRALPNALITTYTYKPLIGISSITDPAGSTTYYDYDSYGRLKETYIMEKDQNGADVKRILQAHGYNYKN